jgi:ribosomal protein S7
MVRVLVCDDVARKAMPILDQEHEVIDVDWAMANYPPRLRIEICITKIKGNRREVYVDTNSKKDLVMYGTSILAERMTIKELDLCSELVHKVTRALGDNWTAYRKGKDTYRRVYYIRPTDYETYLDKRLGRIFGLLSNFNKPCISYQSQRR